MKRRASARDRAALAMEIASLAKADIQDLRERWKTLRGKLPSGQSGRPLLMRAIAYRLQVQAFGGLKPSTRRLLSRAAEDAATGSSLPKPQIRNPKSGTILIREWQGNAHRVTVLDQGVSFNGKRYRSLSEVAREITGSGGQDHGSSDCARQQWRMTIERSKSPIRRCAIYTRKSSEEGLDQDSNSLHAR
jgi:hypothetical protein